MADLLIVKNVSREGPDLQPLDDEVVLATYRQIQTEYNTIGRTIMTNFLSIAGLV